MRKVKLLILGAGTAGISALKEAENHTDDVLLADPGPLGTTCARVGCMPSKALLHIAQQVAATQWLRKQGLASGGLNLDLPAVLAEVRRLRDRLIAGPIRTTKALEDRYLPGAARFVGPDRLQVGAETVQAEAIVIATGTRPIIPEDWELPSKQVLTSDTLFEQPDLPHRIAVIGTGAIGLELGQALAMLGLDVRAFGRSTTLAGIRDPAVNDAARELIGVGMPLHLGSTPAPMAKDGRIEIAVDGKTLEFDAVLAALGRRANIEQLNLGTLGVPLDEHGMPPLDPQTLQVGDLPIYIAGDVAGLRPLMHEAADEGRLAAHYALNPKAASYDRRTALAMLFTEPGIASVGTRFDALPAGALIGELDFSGQGRALLMGKNHGLLRVYADADGYLIGGAMVLPRAEHLAHELAILVQRRLHVSEALTLPYYHPTLEEGLRSALQGVRRQLPERARTPDLPVHSGGD